MQPDAYKEIDDGNKRGGRLENQIQALGDSGDAGGGGRPDGMNTSANQNHPQE